MEASSPSRSKAQRADERFDKREALLRTAVRMLRTWAARGIGVINWDGVFQPRWLGHPYAQFSHAVDATFHDLPAFDRTYPIGRACIHVVSS